MFTIDIDVQKKPGIIELGVQGENAAEAAVFDVTPWVEEYGAGTAYIYHQRLSDAAPYFKELPIVTSDGRSTATWTFDAADTGVKGEGAAQLLFVKDDVIKKTAIYVTVTGRSIGEAGGDVPDPYEDLLEAARQIYQDCHDQAVTATVKASEAAQHEVNAETARDAAEDAAEDAAASAQQARDTFRLAGDTSFSTDPVTRKVTMHFTESE